MIARFQGSALAKALLSGCALAATNPELWLQKPVVRPAVPAGVTNSTNPIDAFIGASLKGRGLQPAGPASKLVLLRRVYFDLIGLPPSPAEQEAFLNDKSPDA
jgi:Protein of unknown function (DUF1549)